MLDCPRNLIGQLRDSGSYAVKGLVVPLRRTNEHTLTVPEIDDLTTKAADLVLERIDELMESRGSTCANDVQRGPMRLDEIGAVLGFTGERVRQFEARALRKLRRSRGALKLEDDVGEDAEWRTMASGCRRL